MMTSPSIQGKQQVWCFMFSILSLTLINVEFLKAGKARTVMLTLTSVNVGSVIITSPVLTVLMFIVGWEGPNCDVDIDECERGFCQNNISCTNWDGGYNCTCKAGYEGQNCTDEMNACQPQPCRNGGTCINQRTDFTCNCVSGE